MSPYTREHCSLTGPLRPAEDKVRYRPALKASDKRDLTIVAALALMFGEALLIWIAWPTREVTWVGIMLLSFMFIVELVRFIQTVTLTTFATKAVDPVPMRPPKDLRVAILTTIVPGKEPWEMVKTTLLRMKEIVYPGGTVTVFLLDEGDNPLIQAECAEIGVQHFSRKGIDEFNRERGFFRRRTKHGNHNAWRAIHEADFDIVGQMDPDHIPFQEFLMRTLGYFNDPDVAYVVAPQVYGNLVDNWIAKGAAVLAYVFHGIIQRGGNGLGAPLLIGTNHLYRTRAWREVGGYADCIIEDHLTAMIVLSSRNSLTGQRWKGVYTPDILAVGEGPTTWADFFRQQMRWAYGIWEILLMHTPRRLYKLGFKRGMVFLMLQSFYPSVAVAWVMSNAATVTFVFTEYVTGKSMIWWTLLWFASVGSSLYLFFWLRKFNLVEHERREYGMVGLGLMLMTIPIYVAAMFQKCLGRDLKYGVTAKGRLASHDSYRNFRTHIGWIIIASSVLIYSFAGGGSSFLMLRLWLLVTIAICAAPLIIHYNRNATAVVAEAVTAIEAKTATIHLPGHAGHGRVTEVTTHLEAQPQRD